MSAARTGQGHHVEHGMNNRPGPAAQKMKQVFIFYWLFAEPREACVDMAMCLFGGDNKLAGIEAHLGA